MLNKFWKITLTITIIRIITLTTIYIFTINLTFKLKGDQSIKLHLNQFYDDVFILLDKLSINISLE